MSDKIRVEIDKELEDLIPTYLSNLEKNMQKIAAAAAAGNQDEVRSLGHNMKGSGGGYGFQQVSEIGKSIEEAAKAGDLDAIPAKIKELKHYLTTIDINYI